MHTIIKEMIFMTNTKTISYKYTMPKLSVKAQTIATVVAVAFVILLPQLIHMIGLETGTGSSLGEMLLPMHLPIIMVGFIAGPVVGTISGFLAPLISFVVTGMPGMVMLPFITIELVVYGFASGVIREVKINTFAKVIIVQIVGRLARSLAILAAVYLMGNAVVKTSVIWTSIKTGLVGILLQLVLIPLSVYVIRKAISNERYAE